MKARRFQELLESVKQARAIERGGLKPARTFQVAAVGAVTANEVKKRARRATSRRRA